MTLKNSGSITIKKKMPRLHTNAITPKLLLEVINANIMPIIGRTLKNR